MQILSNCRFNWCVNSSNWLLRKVGEICDKYKILLIFDEVITGFGRTGSAFASQSFNVTPDMIVFAKGVTNGTIPMGGVAIYKIFRIL